MSKKILQSRYYQLISIIAILMLALSIRLFVLTVLQEDKWAEAAVNQNTKEVVTSAPRGEILDRYGRELATNKQIFTVSFNVSGLETADINRSAYALVKLLEENGDEYVDNFPIVIKKNGQFKYTYDEDKVKWLKSIGLTADATCEEAFNKLRKDYDIDPELDRRDAVEVLQETHGVWPPIAVRSMTFTYDTKKKAYNLFIAKPLLRAVQVLLQDRQKQIMMALPSEVPKSLKEKLDELNTSIKVLDTLVVTTKEEEETP